MVDVGREHRVAHVEVGFQFLVAEVEVGFGGCWRCQRAGGQKAGEKNDGGGSSEFHDVARLCARGTVTTFRAPTTAIWRRFLSETW